MRIRIFTNLLLIFLLAFLSIATVFAEGDLSVDNNSMYFSDNYFLEGQNLIIYVRVNNTSSADLLGTVQITSNTSGQIGTDQVVSVLSGKTDTVFVNWIPTPGAHTITGTISPWNTEQDNSNNNTISQSVYVDYDTDKDGTANQYDNDDDNDGVSDDNDAFPLSISESEDSDGDGIGNNADTDDDNDGTLDSEDDLPLDPNETQDTDGDGIGNNADTDDDNDGIEDAEENIVTNTNPTNADTDGDGVNDKDDDFPLDSTETSDTDGDGTGDNSDEDADNDGIPRGTDKDDLNEGPFIILSEDPGLVSPGTKINIDASPSYDEDGEITDFEWIVDEGAEQKKYTSPYLSTVFEDPGIKKIKLTVTDDKGETRTKHIELRVINYFPYFITGSALIIALALYFGFKYTAGAARKKGKKKTPKKPVAKAKKPSKSKKKS